MCLIPERAMQHNTPMSDAFIRETACPTPPAWFATCASIESRNRETRNW
jgi:hypothetical protein